MNHKMTLLLGILFVTGLVLAGAAGATQRAVLADLFTNTG